MNPSLKAKWIAALRSGKYKQGQGYLNSHGKMCCLGVLCDVIDPSKWEDYKIGGPLCYSSGGGLYKQCSLPQEVIELANINSSIQMYLAKMNDNLEKNFSEIATYIEENL